MSMTPLALMSVEKPIIPVIDWMLKDHANGLEVAVGKNRSGTGLPEGSPLTADQVLAAAEAVLGTLG